MATQPHCAWSKSVSSVWIKNASHPFQAYFARIEEGRYKVSFYSKDNRPVNRQLLIVSFGNQVENYNTKILQDEHLRKVSRAIEKESEKVCFVENA